MLVYGKCECFVTQMLYVSLVCILWQSSILHDLQFVYENARGDNSRRGILQSRSHDYLIGSHECLILFPHAVAVSGIIICRGLCAYTEM